MTKPISVLNSAVFNALKLYPETWSSATTYSLGEVLRPSTYNNHTYICTVAGISNASGEPTWVTTNDSTNTDGTITWTCKDQKCYNVKAVQTASAPYCVFGLETDVTIGDFSDLEGVENATFWVNVFSDKSVADLTELTDEVLNTLDNANLTVSGYTALVCKRDFIGSIIWDSETNVYQQPLRYRIIVSL